VFDPDDMAGHLEVLATSEDFSHAAGFVATLMLRVRSMLADGRLAPIVAPADSLTLDQWLTAYIGAPEATNGAVAVMDLSMVPSDVLHLVIAVVARVVFEALQRYRRQTGDELPTVVVLEEAHTFVQRHLGDESGYATPARMCRETFERIAREGRKFGLGLILSSQRPSELSETVLAQCNTFLLHRLVNDRDQNLVARLVPDNLGGLLRELPSLPSQQAVLLGWATPVPVLVRMNDLPREQRPHSEDPRFWHVWTGAEERPLDWTQISEEWTGGGTAG
jgi:DNA helicase HerA-like ATPase